MAIPILGAMVRGGVKAGRAVNKATSAMNALDGKIRGLGGLGDKISGLDSKIKNAPLNGLKFLANKAFGLDQLDAKSAKKAAAAQKVQEVKGDLNNTFSGGVNPKDSRRLEAIENQLKIISKQLKEFQKGVIDKQDTSIKKSAQGQAPIVVNNSVNNMEPSEKKSWLDMLLGGLAALLGLSVPVLLSMLGGLIGFIKAPLDFLMKWLSKGTNWIWDLLKKGFKAAWGFTSDVFDNVIKWGSKAASWLGNTAAGFWDSIKKAVLSILPEWAGGTPKNKTPNAADADKNAKTKGNQPKQVKSSGGVWDWVSDKATKAKNAVVDGAVYVYEGAKEGVKKGLNYLTELKNKAAEGLKKFGGYIGDAWHKLSNWAKASWTKAVEHLKSIGGTLMKGWESFKDVCNRALSACKDFLLNKLAPLVGKALTTVCGNNSFTKVLSCILTNWAKVFPKILTFLGKAGSKLIPGVGFGVGVYMAWDYFSQGRWGYGIAAAVSAIISLIPGIGGIISCILDLGIGIADILGLGQGDESAEKNEKILADLNKQQNDALSSAKRNQDKEANNKDNKGVPADELDKELAKNNSANAKETQESQKGTKPKTVNLDSKGALGVSSNELSKKYVPHVIGANGNVVQAYNGEIYKGLTFAEAQEFDKQREVLFKAGKHEELKKLEESYKKKGESRILGLTKAGDKADLSVFRTDFEQTQSQNTSSPSGPSISSDSGLIGGPPGPDDPKGEQKMLTEVAKASGQIITSDIKTIRIDDMEKATEEMNKAKSAKEETWTGEFKGKLGAADLSVIGNVAYPTNHNVITSNYGPRNVPGGSKYHKGIDIRGAYGEPVRAMIGGTVISVGGQYGTISIQQPDGLITRYMHMIDNSYKVSRGQQVKAGQVIGAVGGKGPNGNMQYAPHLHLDISKNGQKGFGLEPTDYIKSTGLHFRPKNPNEPFDAYNGQQPSTFTSIMNAGWEGIKGAGKFISNIVSETFTWAKNASKNSSSDTKSISKIFGKPSPGSKGAPNPNKLNKMFSTTTPSKVSSTKITGPSPSSKSGLIGGPPGPNASKAEIEKTIKKIESSTKPTTSKTVTAKTSNQSIGQILGLNAPDSVFLEMTPENFKESFGADKTEILKQAGYNPDGTKVNKNQAPQIKDTVAETNPAAANTGDTNIVSSTSDSGENKDLFNAFTLS